VQVDVRRLEWSDQAAALRERRVDVCLGRLPLDDPDLCVEALYEEPRVLLLPADHPLAGADACDRNHHHRSGWTHRQDRVASVP